MSDTVLKTIPRFPGLELRRPRLLPLFVFIAVLLGLSLFFVWSRIQVVHLDYEISRLETRLREVEQENRRLRLEAASLRNPARIELVAQRDLGLRHPSAEQVIAVE